MPDVTITFEKLQKVVVVHISGSLDYANFTRFDHLLQNFHTQGDYRIIVDCKDMNYIGSAGIGALLFHIKKARDNGGDIVFVQINSRIVKIIELLGFHKNMTLCESMEEAYSQFA